VRPCHSSGAGVIAFGLGMATAAVLGPLALKVIQFRMSARIETQFTGGDIVSLAVVAPISIAAGVLWLSDHPLAPAVALAPVLYAVYTYTSVIAGQEYGRYDGNVERFVPLDAELVAGGVAVATTAWSRLSARDTVAPPATLGRTVAGILLAGSALIALAWAGQIGLVLTGQPPIEYVEGPTLVWTIKLLDVGFLITASVAVGDGLLRGYHTTIRAAYGLCGFVTCLASSVAGMAVAMQANGDPSAQPAVLVLLIPLTIGLGFLTARVIGSSRSGEAAVVDAQVAARRLGAAAPGTGIRRSAG